MNLLNDFKDFSKISYDDYVKTKSFPLFDIQFESGIDFKKVGSKFFIEDETYHLDEYTIGTLLTLILDKLSASANIYYQNSSDFLSSSALFLCDFDNTLYKPLKSQDRLIPIDILQKYSDHYYNEYTLEDLKAYEGGRLLNVSIDKGNYKLEFLREAEIILKYKAKRLNIRAMEEYPVTKKSQIYLTEGFL